MRDGHRVALASVVSTWGSSPRPIGSQLVINDKGEFAGSVSGGCIESYVISEALDVIAEGEPQDLTYGVTDEQAREVRLSCGGKVRVFVEQAPEMDVLKKLSGPQSFARIVDIEKGTSAVVGEEIGEGSLELSKDLLAETRRRLSCDESGVVHDGNREFFISVFAQPRRLIITGAVHIAQALAPMAVAIGYDVTVIDQRPAFAQPERLGAVTILAERTETAMAGIELDARTAVAVLAHDPLLDDPALVAALKSPAFYIGCLGSRKTHAARLQRLGEKGFGESDFKRLYSPVGLDIGGRQPSEIAVSIIAEILAVSHGKR